MAAERTEGLIKTFEAGGTISPYRIVKFGSGDNSVVQSSAATDKSIGVAKIPMGRDYPQVYGEALPAVTRTSGQQLDVVLDGIANVEYGGNVTRGNLLTADSNGKAVAVATTPAAGTRVIGTATVSGVSGDIGAVLLHYSEFRTLA